MVTQSVNYANFVEINYFQLIYYIVWQYLLQTGTGVTKWGNFITKRDKHYYKLGENFALL